MRAGVSWFHIPWPEGSDQGGNTLVYDFWMPRQWTLLEVQACMTTVNTQGTYTLSMLNGVGGNTVLSAATFNMNLLAARTPTDLSLTGTAADLRFSALGLLVISLVSDNGSFDGSGIFLGLLAQEA